MAVITTYRSGKLVYVNQRFVRKSLYHEDKYAWCEQSSEDPRFDVAQGTCDAEDLPEDIRAQCDNYTGAFYPCEWPKSE